jgi:hypothetical protein
MAIGPEKTLILIRPGPKSDSWRNSASDLLLRWTGASVGTFTVAAMIKIFH